MRARARQAAASSRRASGAEIATGQQRAPTKRLRPRRAPPCQGGHNRALCCARRCQPRRKLRAEFCGVMMRSKLAPSRPLVWPTIAWLSGDNLSSFAPSRRPVRILMLRRASERRRRPLGAAAAAAAAAAAEGRWPQNGRAEWISAPKSWASKSLSVLLNSLRGPIERERSFRRGQKYEKRLSVAQLNFA